MIDNNIAYINQSLGDGSIWSAKSRIGSNLSKLVLLLANELQKVRHSTADARTEQDIYQTTINNILNWEYLVGIPDNIFTQTTELTLDNRIRQVMLKLIGFEIMTKTNLMNAIYNIFGINFQIEILSRTKATSFNNIIFGEFKFCDEEVGYNELIIRLPKSINATNGFPYIFPFVFPDNSQKTLIENFIKACVPFNKTVSFQYVL